MKKFSLLLCLIPICLISIFVGCKDPVVQQQQNPQEKIKTYTVSYKTEYGSTPNSISVQSDTILTEEQLPELTASGFVFINWYDGEIKVKPNEYKVTKNLTLIAKWAEGLPLSTDEIPTFDYSTLKEMDTLVILGKITSDSLSIIKSKLDTSEIPFGVDLSNVEDLTIIDENAFNSCQNLTHIELPNTVTTIGKNAFFNCSRLKNLSLPNSVTRIEDNAFQLCTNIENFELPDSITFIGELAFYVCASLKSIKLPSNLETISNRAFEACGELKSIEIPSSVTSIGTGVFTYCSNLETIIFKDTSTWYATENEDFTNGTQIDVTNPESNAINLAGIDGLWQKKFLYKK